ncbi:hypothetical protein, partial [Acinetobacter baumannii]|uniref:hypothetical protein n=1 Tax=Acinetobacter baumannii TaxID=470 RepID=UPI00339A097B
MPDRREPGDWDSMFNRGSQPPSRAAPAIATATRESAHTAIRSGVREKWKLHHRLPQTNGFRRRRRRPAISVGVGLG